MTKVSIVITNYNYGKFLGKALESALGQDYPEEDLEIILVDDASTEEETRVYVEGYEHPRVKKILLKENVGVVRARNLGVEAASGEYILPLDADDWFERDYVRLGAGVLDEKGEVGLVYGLGELVGESSGRWLRPFDMETVLLEGGTPSCSMYRKSVWRSVGGYHDYMYHGWEDWDFWLSVIEKGYKIEAVEGTVGFYYRIKAHSRTKNAAEKNIQNLWRNLYTHHRSLYAQYPDLMRRVLIECSHGRVLLRSPEYRVGRMVTRCLSVLFKPFLPMILRWKNTIERNNKNKR